MNTEYKFNSTLPFSLHDMSFNEMEYRDGKLTLHFTNGYVELCKPCRQVEGNITISGVDMDFAVVYVFDGIGGLGRFSGKKMPLEEFMSCYKEFNFEITDELYGYNQLEYSGYLTLPGEESLHEVIMTLYYTGTINYTTI